MPLGVVTVTASVSPSVPGGLVVVISSSLTTWNGTDVPPNMTAVAPVKNSPLSVTGVPPPTGPADGETTFNCGTSA